MPMIFGGTILLVVLLLLLYCKQRNVRAWYIHAAIQLAGLVGVLSFSDASVIAGITYAFILSVIYGYNAAGSNEIMTSPLYTTVFLALLFFFERQTSHLPRKEKEVDALYHLVQNILHTGGDKMLLSSILVISSLSLIILNIWTKRHSVLIYLWTGLCLLFSGFLLIVSLAASGFRLGA